MAWWMLLLAGLCEVMWAVGLKASGGLRFSFTTVGIVCCMMLSVFFINIAIKTIPISIAYAAWTGIGVVGVTIVGVSFLGETLTLWQIIFLLLIATGVVGLKLTTG